MSHDQLEHDLRQLLTADRLDLPVRPDAPASVRGGLATRRRHRTQARAAGAVLAAALAGFTAVSALPQLAHRTTPAVTATPTTTLASPTSTPSRTPAPSRTTPSGTTTGPERSGSTTGTPSSESTGEALVSHGRYGPLKVGMSVDAARATGWLVGLPDQLHPDPVRRCAGWFPDKDGRAAVFLSDRGIEAMIFSRDVHTISDVAIGDPWAKVFSVYEAQGIVGDPAGSEASLPLQGKPAARMRFVREYDDTVAQIVVERLDQDCFG